MNKGHEEPLECEHGMHPHMCGLCFDYCSDCNQETGESCEKHGGPETGVTLERAAMCAVALSGIKGNPEDIRAVLMAAKRYMESKNDTALLRQDELRQAVKKVEFPEE